MMKTGATFEIKDNKTYIYIDDGERYEVDITSFVVDEVNQLVTIITDGYWDGCVIQTGSSINIFDYILIYDNQQIVNICLVEYGSDIYWQNENGIIADIEGIYVNETGDERIILSPEQKSITSQYLSNYGGETHWNDASIIDGLYLKINGQYWTRYGWITSFVIDENTLSFEGQTYTRQNATMPEEYYNLGAGDIINGYKPTSYDSANPYTVSLAGCSGDFYTEDLQWTVTYVNPYTGVVEMKAKGVTSKQLSLTGANGWNNSLTALNDVCLSVYGGSTSKYTAISRSITFEDMGITVTPDSSSYAASSYGSNNKFPTSYLTEEQGLTGVTEDINGCGYASNSDIIVTNTSFILSSDYSSRLERVDKEYWVNKKCVIAKSGTAAFSVGWVTNSSAHSASEATLFESSGTESTQTKSVRPVVTLTISDWSCLSTTDGTNWTISN